MAFLLDNRNIKWYCRGKKQRTYNHKTVRTLKIKKFKVEKEKNVFKTDSMKITNSIQRQCMVLDYVLLLKEN